MLYLEINVNQLNSHRYVVIFCIMVAVGYIGIL